MSRQLLTATLSLTLLLSSASAQFAPGPIVIEPGVPQFVHDDMLVDSHWGLKTKSQPVTRVFHHPEKHPENPFKNFTSDKPGYMTFAVDEDESGAPLYRMYYQANFLIPNPPENSAKYRTDVAYAESKDGVHWIKPDLNLFPEKTWAKPNNIVISTPDRPNAQSNGPFILENIPDKDKRGYKHILLYRAGGNGNGDIAGIHLIGTRDGIHFDPESDMQIAHLHSDTSNSICYDPARETYQLFCRAKQMYRAFGDTMIDTGASRRVASMRSAELWTDWMKDDAPQTLLVPDEVDSAKRYHYFYGMPTVNRHGIYWGFLQCFMLNDFIHTEVVTSRDGRNWTRLHDRPPIIDYGADGTWDDNMIFASPNWIEAGNEWRFYYNGWDGAHGGTNRESALGLATCLRERLFSRRGPPGGGVVCTREILWPGGDLWINTGSIEERAGEVSIRISGPRRKVFPEFDHQNSEIAAGKDPTRQLVQWGGKSLDLLKGKSIRIEFFLKDFDLFSFGAFGKDQEN